MKRRDWVIAVVLAALIPLAVGLLMFGLLIEPQDTIGQLEGCTYALDCCGDGPTCYKAAGTISGSLPACPAGLPLRELVIRCEP